MRLPNAERAIVPPAKIVNYLLSPTHRAGKSKAAFFSGFGFSANDWPAMAAALRRHATDNAVSMTAETAFGVRYVIDGPMRAPDETLLNVRSVWYIDAERDAPRFVTAHPLRKETR
jgi:hypothetical protein